MRLPLTIGAPVGAFALFTLGAELFGAPNLGTAMTFGQMAFVAVLTALLVRA